MRETKEWTLMFFMASDNPLAISIVSQLKAIKAAGFHHDANVVVQFDPYTEGTPTHIFDVNVVNKLKYKKNNIGFQGDDDPLVRNLIEDKLWKNEIGEAGEPVRNVLQKVLKAKFNVDYNPPEPEEQNGNSQTGALNDTSNAATLNAASQAGNLNVNSKAADANGNSNAANGNGNPPRRRRRRHEPDPLDSLHEFLKFCRRKYPAKHYMLFILGHGVVVGNDIFLFDEHAENQSITLNQLGYELRTFKKELPRGATFELVSFHSCSVSSLEVAYELENTANYFLASQGPTFVGSWPYQQILMRIFKDLKANPTDREIRNTITEIFYYCLQNSADFLLAGYSYQLTLCDLRKVSELNDAIQNLSNALYAGLEDAASTFIILYSHWKAQSFFQEIYTDLYDFCFCIVDRCKRIEAAKRIEGNPDPYLRGPLSAIRDACEQVMQKLDKPTGPDDRRHQNTFVVASEFAGPAYQYSRGLSIYFPWSRPSADSGIMEEYAEYTFHTKFHSKPDEQGPERKSWRDFLDQYFKSTQRVARGTELLWEVPDDEKASKLGPQPKLTLEQKLNEDILSLIYSGEGPLTGSLAKDDPTDRTGGECGCPSFKNYPLDTRTRDIRRRQAQSMPVSGSLFGELEPTIL